MDKSNNVKHTRIGVWDLYEDESARPVYSRLRWPGFESYATIAQALPYVWRMIKDIAFTPDCSLLLLAYLLVELVISLGPALSLYYSGKLLIIVQTAVEHRTVDKRLLFHVAVGKFACSVATRALRHAKQRISYPLHLRVKNYYSVHIFHAMVRLDLPTFDDPTVQRQIEQTLPKYAHSSTAFDAVTSALRLFTTAVELISQLSVLINVLKDQSDGPLLATLSVAQACLQWSKVRLPFSRDGVWAATTTNNDYLKAEGLKRVVTNPVHRKEIVASGIGSYLLSEYRRVISRVPSAGDFYDVLGSQAGMRDMFSLSILLQEIFHGLPEVIFSLRAVDQPASIPLSLATLHLITRSTNTFTYTAFSLYDETGAIAEKLTAVRLLYEIIKIPNRVKVDVPEKTNPDVDYDEPSLGVPFPEKQQSLNWGISIEFRQVSFKYPGSDTYALRDVSFKIEKGQLCVIVGNNGSGKSTILKLISRLYDPTEGQIFIDDIDIKKIRLSDLRRAISVLFQDYTLFPLSIYDNISLGDPQHATDQSKIQQAAQLGGAASFIETLPDKYNSYLERPVRDYYSSVPEGSTTLFGQPVDYGKLRRAVGRSLGASDGLSGNRGLSGGQMQRIALSRTFMRSVVSEDSLGLLLFDEPSASLDPTAEHDLFERLRQLRGSKTMIFSSHRFGNLTRHADLILYMDKSVIIEEGTHDQLLQKAGEYARIWMLQACAFL